jgi:hypothetical protein
VTVVERRPAPPFPPKRNSALPPVSCPQSVEQFAMRLQNGSDVTDRHACAGSGAPDIASARGVFAIAQRACPARRGAQATPRCSPDSSRRIERQYPGAAFSPFSVNQTDPGAGDSRSNCEVHTI